MNASAVFARPRSAAAQRLKLSETENDAQSAADTLSRYLDRQTSLPDALIAGNNPILLGSLKQLQQRQIAIPDDMALIASMNSTGRRY